MRTLRTRWNSGIASNKNILGRMMISIWDMAKLRRKFTHIPAEIPEVHIASHVQPDTGAVHAPPVPSMSYIAAAIRANAGLAPTTGVSHPTGVGPTN
eukprot:12985282-Ditylum_brightwellii.AAC.1